MTKELEAYPYEIRPLTPEEGGGFLISFTDFGGCFGDGETEQEAIEYGKKALAAMIAAFKEEGWPIPSPGSRARRSETPI